MCHKYKFVYISTSNKIMSTKKVMGEKKIVREDGKVYANGRVYSEKAYQHFLNYKQEFDKQSYRRFVFRLDNKNSQDLMAYLDSKENFAGFMRELVRKEMEKEIENGTYNPETDTEE